MSSIYISASAETLLKQASDTADDYMSRAIGAVEDHLGKGATEKYPQLVAAHMNAAALDFHASMNRVGTQTAEEALQKIGYELERLVDYFNSGPWVEVRHPQDEDITKL